MNQVWNDSDPQRHFNCRFHALAPVSAIALSESLDCLPDRLPGTLYHLQFNALLLSELSSHFWKLIYFAFRILWFYCNAPSMYLVYSRRYIKLSFLSYVTEGGEGKRTGIQKVGHICSSPILKYQTPVNFTSSLQLIAVLLTYHSYCSNFFPTPPVKHWLQHHVSSRNQAPEQLCNIAKFIK